MPVMKTRETDEDVEAFFARIDNAGRVEDARSVMDLMACVTGCSPRMWGPSIIGFDRYDYKRADGSEHASFITGLAPRKASLVIYITPGFESFKEQLTRLGPHKSSVSCLYLGRLAKIDLDVLEDMIHQSVEEMRARYG